MSTIDERFAEFRAANKKALMPFLTAGDPDLETTTELIDAFDGLGCGFCELGIPYSDPIADGPVIQASYTRALEAQVTPDRIIDSLANRKRNRMPVVTMVSYSIVFRMGVDRYLERASDAGISGLIVPDLPFDEADVLAGRCQANNMSLIQLIAPTTNRERAKKIAALSQGFIYYVSIAGITGERRDLPNELVDNVSWLKELTETPVCVGFGISQPDQAKQVAKIADGVIVGSAIVRRIAAIRPDERSKGVNEVKSYVQSLVSAMK